MLTIRHAAVSDVDMINAIHNAAVALPFASANPQPRTVEKHYDWLNNRRLMEEPVFIGLLDNEILGYAYLSLYREGRPAVSDTREISYFVHPDHHRRGIASALVQHIIATCGQIDVRHLISFVISDNTASIALLRKFRFVDWGRFPGVVNVDGQQTDHLVLGRRVK